MKDILAGALVGMITALFVNWYHESSRAADFIEIYETGLADGKKKALYDRPPSEDLELVCAGLWAAEQTQKYILRGEK